MLRVNANLFYELSVKIHPLTEVGHDTPLPSICFTLYEAKQWLEWFLSGRIVPLRVCQATGWELVTAIQPVLPKDFPAAGSWPTEGTLEYNGILISTRAKDFETVFAAELQTLDTYVISQKGIYSTPDLIERADMALDEQVRKVISSNALDDFRQAGRCLAFDLNTASGFHAMRATEAVLRQYHGLVVKPTTGNPVDMAQCINELRKAGADAKTLGILDQIRDLHRNTVMHPEAFLTPAEGLRLFDIAKSAISAMADQITAITAVPPATGLGKLAAAAPST
jgi:hypothetical protein